MSKLSIRALVKVNSDEKQYRTRAVNNSFYYGSEKIFGYAEISPDSDLHGKHLSSDSLREFKEEIREKADWYVFKRETP